MRGAAATLEGRSRRAPGTLWLLVVLSACGVDSPGRIEVDARATPRPVDARASTDAGPRDAGPRDAGPSRDATFPQGDTTTDAAAPHDAQSGPPDAFDVVDARPVTPNRSAKRGIAYNLRDSGDFEALSAGVSWWYNWGPSPDIGGPDEVGARFGMDYMPMLWNGNFDDARTVELLRANPGVRYLLLLNEPNLTDQANMRPQAAAVLWPRYEAVAATTGVQLVGPAITWGTLAGYNDPVVWMDAFYAEYRARNDGRDPRIDYLAFHWYDYGLGGQLDRLRKYGKTFWVTEFANWHSGDGPHIDTVEAQKAQMTEMVAECESRADVFRYAWFTGRWENDVHHTSLLGASGELTALGRHYVSLPFTNPAGEGR